MPRVINSRRSDLRWLAFSMAALVIAAAGCGGTGAVGTATPTGGALFTPPADDELFLFLITTDASVGENRLPFALRRADGSRVNEQPSNVTLRYTHRDGGETYTAPEATFRQWPFGGGIYTTELSFEKAGLWDFEVSIPAADDGAESATAVALVKETSSTPAVGEPVPPTPSKTAQTAEDLPQITSDPEPHLELYAVSVDDAIRAGKPVVVTFSTPAYCTTQTCGPQVDTLHEVQQRHGDEAAFIHIELFDNPHEMQGDPTKGIQSPLVETWGLTSEPWTFVIDSEGRVAAKFEAYTTAEEIEEALQALRAGS